MKRALVIVLDSVGCGNAPDAALYGDDGTNTLGHLFARVENFDLPILGNLGLYNILGLHDRSAEPLNLKSAAFRLTEKSSGKDTVTGHWELMGLLTEKPLFTCDSFPLEFVRRLESEVEIEFLGNKRASGTEILKELGEEHLRTGSPILYTSADSVLQIAAHEEVFGLERLYDICEHTRKLLDDLEMRVGRVIARPFLGTTSESFQRTTNRHDYSLTPGYTVLNKLVDHGVAVVGIGKIHDIFAGSGVSKSIPTVSNSDGMNRIVETWAKRSDGDTLYFVNLVDFDSLYGHRRDPEGYADCLQEFDQWLGDFLGLITNKDLIIITADHGNDPFHTGTDHTREQVPCLILGDSEQFQEELQEFSDVARCLERFFRKK